MLLKGLRQGGNVLPASLGASSLKTGEQRALHCRAPLGGELVSDILSSGCQRFLKRGFPVGSDGSL